MKLEREEHCVIINKSPRTSLKYQSEFSKVSKLNLKKVSWQKLHYMVIFFISGTTTTSRIFASLSVCQIGFAGTDNHNISIDVAVRYRQLFTRYEKYHSLLHSKGHFDANKKPEPYR